jgi:hypothetical protein
MELAPVETQGKCERESNQSDRPVGHRPIQERNDFTPKAAQEMLQQDIHTASRGNPESLIAMYDGPGSRPEEQKLCNVNGVLNAAKK